MNKNIEIILDETLLEIKNGKTQEECIKKYKEYEVELREFFTLTRNLENIKIPEPQKLNSTLIKIGEALKEKKQNEKIFFSFKSFAFKFASAFLVLILIGWGTVAISENAIPGDIFYPIKIAFEKITFIITVDEQNRSELRISFSDNRLNELIQLINKTGKVDTRLLSKVLDETKLALEENKLEGDNAAIFLSKLNNFSNYQKNILEHVKPYVKEEDRMYIDNAIKVCEQRCNCIKKMIQEKNSMQKPHWCEGCN
jgi:hypothetical protein